MKKISAVIRPFKLEAVKTALVDSGVAGMTISEVGGFGRQLGIVPSSTESQPVNEFRQKLRVEIVVTDERVEQVLEKLTQTARTGQIGDGKVFITPIENAIRIRTGEMGSEVL